MKPINMPVVCALLIVASGPALAGDNAFSLSAGMEYSTGNYGAQESTDIQYFPVTGKYQAGPLILKLMVPYVSITGPANVIGGLGNVMPVATAGGGTPPRRSASGQGDVVAAGSYNVYQNGATGLLLDLTGKVKFATADDSKGLGTGKNDFSLQADVVKQRGAWMLFGSLGWRKMGDPDGSDFKDPWFGSAGASYGLNAATQLGALYETRQSVIDGGAKLSELMLFASYQLAPSYTLQGYVIKGFTDGSPDWGGGTVLNRHF
ncbi:MAG: hypothetical protein WAZ34_16030 [Rhodocyclaceae bacterium]